MKQEETISLSNLELHSIFRDLCQNVWMIIAAMLIGAMGCYVALHTVIKPVYTSSATIVVSAKNTKSAYSELRNSTAMASAFKEVLGSELLKTKVIEDLGVPDFPGALSAEVIPETNLLVLSVSAGSPLEAFQVMESVIRVYPTISDYIFSNAVLNIISHPVVAEKPSNSMREEFAILLSAAGGFLLMAGILALLSFLKDTIKTESAFREKVDGKLIATVYHEKKYYSLRSWLERNKRKSSLLITNQAIGFSFVETFHKICPSVEHNLSVEQHGKVFLVASVAEDEGKSTVAANIALALAQKGYRTMLVDADFRKPAQYKIFEKPVRMEQELGRGLESGVADWRKLVFYDEKQKLYMLLGTRKYKNSAELIICEAMKQMLEQCRSEMDYVILDTPPMILVSDTEGLIDLVDSSILVVHQDKAYTADINDAIDILRQGSNFMGCIFNNVPMTPTSFLSGEYGYNGDYGYGQKRKKTNETKQSDGISSNASRPFHSERVSNQAKEKITLESDMEGQRSTRSESNIKSTERRKD